MLIDKKIESGIEWVGEIPENWSIFPAGGVFSEVKEKNTNNEYCNAFSFRYGEIVDKNTNGIDDEHTNETLSSYRIVIPNTIMINGLNLNYDFITQRVAIVKEKGIITSAYLAVQPDETRIVAKFALYLFKAYDAKQAFHGMGTGVRKTLKYSDFKNIKIVAPSMTEQQCIVDFLDRKVQEIEALIAEIKVSIEEYKIWKASIIYEAVTKGLDPNVEMKDSGVEWISHIPANWNVKRTKALFSYGKGLPITKENLVEEGIPVISYGQIHSKKNTGTGVIEELIRFVPESYINSNPDSLVKKGDILVADTSEDLAGCGNAVYVDSDMTLFAGYHTIILKSNSVSDNKYIAYLMKTDAWRSQIRANVSGVKLFSISKRILNSTSVILPSIEEQKEITNYLDAKCTAIDEIITEKELLIFDLEKYKKSLIFDVVTGKRRV